MYPGLCEEKLEWVVKGYDSAHRASGSRVSVGRLCPSKNRLAESAHHYPWHEFIDRVKDRWWALRPDVGPCSISFP